MSCAGVGENDRAAGGPPRTGAPVGDRPQPGGAGAATPRVSGSIVEASLTESLEASGTGVLTGSRQAEMTENSRSELFSDDGLVATMDGFAVPEHIRPDVDTIRRVDGLRSDAVNEDAKMSTVGWDRPPLGGMGAADPGVDAEVGGSEVARNFVRGGRGRATDPSSPVARGLAMFDSPGRTQ